MTDPDTIPERARRAKTYFEEDYNLGGQRAWYDRKASSAKRWHVWLGFTIIAAGGMTTVVQVWAPTPPDTPVHWTVWLTALLGALVFLAKGSERIWSFDEVWQGYRLAAEAMKAERRLYVNAAGPYNDAPDEEVAFRRFVERVEQILASEQQRFWQLNDTQGEEPGATDS